MSEGYLMLQRRFFSHPLWRESREFSRAEAFLDLLQLAAYAHREQIIKGSLVKLAPGQLCGSQRYLADRWGWSTKKVRHFIALLESDRIIEPQKNRDGTIITLCNYEKYNIRESDSGTERNHQGTTKEPPRNRIKEREEREEHSLGLFGEGEGELPGMPPSAPEPPRCLPKGWQKLTQTQKDQTRVNFNTPTMQRLGATHGRRATTLWTVAEAEALLRVKPDDEEITLMIEFYEAVIPNPDVNDRRRQQLQTLLNNWNGELDKARIWKSTQRQRASA